MRSTLTRVALFLAAFAPAAALAQSVIRLPQASPAATAGQTIGITDVEIRYHRPAVNKRKIWGGLVPYGVLWRAGANENTTISFSTPVKVEGKPVPAGTYALYMVPGASEWTLVLSKFTGDWGTYNYDPSEDALRVPVSPRPLAEAEERLLYTFDDLADASAVASLRWEKLRVPFRIEVDLPATIRASIREELRGGKHWSSDAWAAAARWELRNGDPKTALEYANHGLAIGSSFTALRTKAAVLEKNGDAKGAAELRQRAALVANEAETISVAVAPMMAGKEIRRGDLVPLELRGETSRQLRALESPRGARRRVRRERRPRPREGGIRPGDGRGARLLREDGSAGLDQRGRSGGALGRPVQRRSAARPEPDGRAQNGTAEAY